MNYLLLYVQLYSIYIILNKYQNIYYIQECYKLLMSGTWFDSEIPLSMYLHLKTKENSLKIGFTLSKRISFIYSYNYILLLMP